MASGGRRGVRASGLAALKRGNKFAGGPVTMRPTKAAAAPKAAPTTKVTGNTSNLTAGSTVTVNRGKRKGQQATVERVHPTVRRDSSGNPIHMVVLKGSEPESRRRLEISAVSPSSVSDASPRPAPTRKVAAKAGSGRTVTPSAPSAPERSSRVSVSSGASAFPRSRRPATQKAGSGPLVRAGNGSLNLRGGTRGNWKRDFRGRFA